MVRRTSLLVLIVLVAGCAAPAAEERATAPDAPATLFSSTSCDEAGGYVVWNLGGLGDAGPGLLPAPFVYADATDDVGDPPITAWGEVPRKPLAGAYHGVITCPTWTMGGVERTDLVIAFVTGRIEPPPFDTSPLAREYLVGVIGVNDAELDAALLAHGIHTDPLLAAELSFDGGLMRSTMSFAHHGEIISVVPVETRSARDAETMRLWLLAPLHGGGARPVALDIVDVGGIQLIASSPGHFDHRATSPAPPLPGLVPLHEFNSWALGYRGVERSVRLGPVVDVVLAGGGHG